MDRTKLLIEGAKGLKDKFTADELKALARFILGLMGKDKPQYVQLADNLIDTAIGKNETA